MRLKYKKSRGKYRGKEAVGGKRRDGDDNKGLKRRKRIEGQREEGGGEMEEQRKGQTKGGTTPIETAGGGKMERIRGEEKKR